MTATLPIDQLIDPRRGTISREIFVSPEFHREELEKLFTRAWLFVGHESQIPKPGDFFVSRMGEESVILCRDTQGAVHVFLNSCRHRGMKVCRYEQGNTSLFVCPYHSWSYTTDGKLQGVPLYRALYEGTLNRDEWSLIEVPKLALYKGTVWASWDPAAPDLLDYLGGAVDHLDQVLDCRDGTARRIGSDRRAQMDLPLQLEVRRGEFPGRHLSQPVAPLGGHDRHRPQRTARREGAARQRIQQGPARVGRPSGRSRHAQRADAGTMEYEPSYAQYPAVDEYFRHCFDERKRRLGEKARLLPFTGNIFPNASYHGRQPRGICVWHPHSPTETEGWRFFLVDADAPAEVKDVLRRFYMRYSGPAGMTEQDDMENWLYATAAAKGTIARRYPFNYQMSMGAYKTDDPIPGDVSLQITDQTPRNYYRVYASYLKGDDWDTLIGRDRRPVQVAAE